MLMEMSSLENQFLIAMPTLEDGCFDKTVTYICEHNDEGAMGLIINSPLNISLVELLKKVDFSNYPGISEEEETAELVSVIEEKEALLAEKSLPEAYQKILEEELQENPEQSTEQDTVRASQQGAIANKAEDESEKNNQEKVAVELLKFLKEQRQESSSELVSKDEAEEATSVSESIKNSLEQLVLLGGPLDQERGFVLHSTQHGWQSSIAISEELMITSSKDILLALGTEKAPELFIIALGHASWAPGQLEEEIQANLWLTTPVDTDIIFNTPVAQRWKQATASLGIDVAHLSSDVGHA